MKIMISSCNGGYKVIIEGNRTFNPEKVLSEVAPHLIWTGTSEDVYLPKELTLELVHSETINPLVKTVGDLSLDAGSIILALSCHSKLPEELSNAQILSIGQLIKSSENGLGYLSLMNGGIKFSPTHAERKYLDKQLYVVTQSGSSGVHVVPSFANSDFCHDPTSG